MVISKKQAGIVAGAFAIGVVLCAVFLMSFTPHLVGLYGTVGIDLETLSIHSRIRIWKGNELILDEWHSGVVTDLGDNMTMYWIFGDTDMQYKNIPYMDNGTYITIGNDTGTLGASSTVLPNEWNRTVATIEDETQSQLNLTCTFYPTGLKKADCIGINLNSTANSNNLIMYDTFTEVTGIDDTFTINVEFQISVAHS